MSDIVLSFIVVTYNHERFIARCLDSILAQNLIVPYEIIVGDDRSTDCTWEIIQSYKEKYPNVFTIYRVNSDECDPVTLSDRASYNRGHAYKFVKGKYYAEVDGDDYLLPGNTYQKQVELLESNPSCWLCMQKIKRVDDGKSADMAKDYNPIAFSTGQIITAEEYIRHPEWFAQHQSFVYRRNDRINPIDMLGLNYEDTTATLFHLMFGSIVCLNQSGYLWINYSNGVNGSLRNDDRLVSFALLQVEHILFFPQFASAIFDASMPEWIHLFKQTDLHDLQLSENIQRSFMRFEGFVFAYYSENKHSIFEKTRFKILRYLMLIVKKKGIQMRFVKRLVLSLMINSKSANRIFNERYNYRNLSASAISR